MKIIELRATNIQRLRAVDITPGEHVVILGGDNEQGKSSCFDAIEMTLAGAKGMSRFPVRRGADEGEVFLDLGDITATLKVYPTNPPTRKLIVKDADGALVSSPQAVLEKLYSKVSFRPMDFFTKPPKDQAELLRKLVGIDTSKIDASRAKVYEERTAVGRRLENTSQRLTSIPKECLSAPDEQIDISSLMDEKLKVDKNNEDYRHALRECTAANSKVDELKAQLEQAEIDLSECMHKVRLLDPIDTDALVEKIKGASSINEKVLQKKLRNQLSHECKELEREQENLTKRIKEIDEEKRRMIDEAKWPVPGLGFDKDGITFQGLPFEQASSARRMQVALSIGAAVNPTLKVLLLQNASLIDEKMMGIIRDFAVEHDFQIWLERVGGKDPGAIIIEDGMVVDSSGDA